MLVVETLCIDQASAGPGKACRTHNGLRLVAMEVETLQGHQGVLRETGYCFHFREFVGLWRIYCHYFEII